jgi:two-component system phosphate regulon response regulator PhoB
MDTFTIQSMIPATTQGLNRTKGETMRNHILLVEDEAEIRQLIALHLKRNGFEVDEAADGEEAHRKLENGSYELLILDWMLPGLSGLEITRMIRARRPAIKVPILFVTAKTEPEDVVRGLEAGADDYITKPFDNAILLARVNALLRRFEWLDQQEAKPSSLLVVGPLAMNTDTYEVSLDSQPMDLTRSEFRLLQALLENQGRVLSRDRLIEQIQGEGVNVVGRTVDTHVFGLRKKLGPFCEMIETIRGVGYRVRYV